MATAVYPPLPGPTTVARSGSAELEACLPYFFLSHVSILTNTTWVERSEAITITVVD